MPTYVYEIKNKLNGKRYIGSRKCKVEPQNDLGIKYFSSSHNKEFMKEQKEMLKAKTEALKSEKRVEELYAQALDAMRKYSGQEVVEEEPYEEL